MKIKVIGKSHLEGTSRKTGRPYNFNQLHFTAPARGVEGVAAQVVSYDPAIFPLDRVEVGKSYELDLDLRGYVTAISRID